MTQKFDQQADCASNRADESRPIEEGIPVLQELRRSHRARVEPERYYDFAISLDQDPETYKEAMASPDSDKWLDAMRSEMESMYTNQV